MKRIICIVTLLVALGVSGAQQAQAQVALKTNLLYDATLTPNLGVEIGTAKRQTFQLHYGLHPWAISHDGVERQIEHWYLSPEYRWWFCQKFNGAFVGVHAHGGQFNVKNIDLPTFIDNIYGTEELASNRYQGWYVGGGVTLGYQWVMSKHWNFEAALGAGYAYIDYDKYTCEDCARLLDDNNAHYWGITKANLSLLYIF